jgi:hypothetical protein
VRLRLSEWRKEFRNFQARASVAGLHRCHGQAQSHSNVSDSKLLDVAKQNHLPVLFRQPGESSANSSTCLPSLALDKRRGALIGNEQFRGERKKLQARGRLAFPPPLPRLIETNLNQPCPEACFESKLREVGESLQSSLLDNVLGFWMATHCGLDCMC